MAMAHFHFAYIQGVVSFKIIIETLFSFVENSKNYPFSNKLISNRYYNSPKTIKSSPRNTNEISMLLRGIKHNKTNMNLNGNKFVMTYIFLISSVGSARMTNRPSSISGRKIMRSMSGTASSTEIQEMTNWRANVFLVNTRSRSEGMKPTKSNVALSVTMS